MLSLTSGSINQLILLYLINLLTYCNNKNVLKKRKESELLFAHIRQAAP